MGRTNDQMATTDDEPPNSGLWGHVEVEALPNPGSLPPPPPETAPIHRGTLMGFAVPPAVANANRTQPGPQRRTPNSGTATVGSSSKTLTSGVVPPPTLEAHVGTLVGTTVVPATSPIGAVPKDTLLAPGGEPVARGYYHASQATRTLIGGSVPAPPNVSGATGATGKRATAPGFPTLAEPSPLNKNTLVGVAVAPSLTDRVQAGTSEHPTYRSPPTDTSVSTERDLRAAVPNDGVVGGLSGAARTSIQPPAGAASHLGRFRIQQRLGAGGVGAVYLASKVDATGNGSQLLAVKVLREHFYREPSTLKALFREARLAARMDHRHIVRVFDIGYHNKHPYLVMEYVDGLSLATLLTHGAELPLSVGIRCLIDALHGLDFAHKLRGDEGEPLGLVHCDVSPQNILVGVDGVAKVTDFGVARTREEDGGEFVLRCKPEFAAPELLLEEPVRPETDVFSAGAVLYRLATGELPFPGETEDEIIEKLRTVEPRPPTQIKVDLPQFLDAFCAQAMAKTVGDRFRTCLDMARSLERQAEAAGLLADRLTVGTWVQSVRRAMAHGDIAQPPPRRSLPPVEEELNGAAPTRREPRTNRAVWIGAAIAAAVVAGGALLWWLTWYDEQRREERRRELAPAASTLLDQSPAPLGSAGSVAPPPTVQPRFEQPSADEPRALPNVAAVAPGAAQPATPAAVQVAPRPASAPRSPGGVPRVAGSAAITPPGAPKPLTASPQARVRPLGAPLTGRSVPGAQQNAPATAGLIRPATSTSASALPAPQPPTPLPAPVGSRGF